jgi:phospholipid/cholesterol/gamma-HCH transport system substrate-binding protein
MRPASTELKVGSFALIILALLTFMTFKVGGFNWAKKKGYTVYAEFKNVGGLDEKTRVKIAGVDSGTIEKIELKEGKAKLTIMINRDVVLYSDSSVGVRSSGLLGDRYLEVKSGKEEPKLKDKDTIKNVVEIVDMDDLIRNITEVSGSINRLSSSLEETIATPEGKKSIKDIVDNLRDVSANLKDAVKVNDEKLRVVLDNLKEFTASLKDKGPELVANLNKASSELKELIEENRPGVKSAVQSIDEITQKIAKGEGTIGKLVKDDRLYESVNKAAEGVNKTLGAVDRFKTFITFQGDYLTKAKDVKGQFYVTLQPTPEKYYILGIVSDPVGRVRTIETTTTTGGISIVKKEEEVEKKIEFTALFGRRFNNLAMRLGMIETTFGFGADYFFNDKAKLTADVWDFSNEEDGSKNPHLKVGIEYIIYKNLFLTAGGDNLLNKKRRGAYVGAGLKFEDEDFKYLFGTLPKIK